MGVRAEFNGTKIGDQPRTFEGNLLRTELADSLLGASNLGIEALYLSGPSRYSLGKHTPRPSLSPCSAVRQSREGWLSSASVAMSVLLGFVAQWVATRA